MNTIIKQIDLIENIKNTLQQQAPEITSCCTADLYPAPIPSQPRTDSFIFNPSIHGGVCSGASYGGNYLDTQINVNMGQSLRIRASGLIHINNGSGFQWSDPNGWTTSPPNNSSCLNISFFPTQLLGRIGSNGTPFTLGTDTTIIANNNGNLLLFLYDTPLSDNIGQWDIVIDH